MVYQEQIMQTAQVLAGYTLGAADILRRAMGKKKMDVMQQQREIFREGCARANNIPGDKANEIFDIMMKFAEYGFNRSHSAAYSVVAFQTAYLKANYPADYMASVLTNNMGDIKKVTFFMEECKRMGIPVLGPDVRESAYKFTVNEKGGIRFGLGAIKGVGEGAVECILRERIANGPYTSVFDFAARLDLRTVNKKNFESLALAGAFDSFEGVHRAQYFAEDEKGQSLIEKAMRYGNALQDSKNSAQVSLFGESSEAEIPEPPIPSAEPWRTLDQLNREKEVVGIYISGHPLDDYRFEIENFTNASVTQLENLLDMKGRDIRVAGIITSVSHLTTKTGSPFGKFILEDYEGAFEFAIFKDDYLKFRPYMNEHWFVLAQLQVRTWQDKRDGREIPRINILKMELLSELREKLVKKVSVDIPLDKVSDNLIERIKKLCKSERGNVPFQVNIFENGTRVEMPSRSMKINLSRDLTNELDRIDEITWNIEKV